MSQSDNTNNYLRIVRFCSGNTHCCSTVSHVNPTDYCDYNNVHVELCDKPNDGFTCKWWHADKEEIIALIKSPEYNNGPINLTERKKFRINILDSIFYRLMAKKIKFGQYKRNDSQICDGFIEIYESDWDAVRAICLECAHFWNLSDDEVNPVIRDIAIKYNEIRKENESLKDDIERNLVKFDEIKKIIFD